MSLSPGSTVIDQEKLKQLMAGGPNVPMIAPPLSDVPASPQLPGLNFKQRQAMPLTSPGVATGSSGYYQNKLSRLDDQQANPLGSADNHHGVLGKIGHALGTIGNKALDVTGINTIPGTEANREARMSYDQAMIPKTQEVELGQKREAANETYQTGELADRAAGRKLEQQREDATEAKQTPEQQSLEDLQGQINPKTGTNYTPAEAEIERAQRLQDTKPDKAVNTPLHTVTMLDAPGGKPYLYQYVQGGKFAGNEGNGEFKKIGPAQPNAATIGMVGTMQPLLGQNGEITGFYNSKDPRKNITAEQAGLGGGEGTTSSGARLGNTERNQFNTAYVKPATDIEQNFQKFMGARKEYDNNPATGAASMAALAQHLGSTFGSIRGAQMGENMIHEHKEAIGLFDRLGRYADQLQSGQQLSKSQWDDFQKLITNTRDIQWETTAREAARRGQPVDFLPADTHIQLSDSAGHSRYVRGDQVQQYLANGAKIQ